MQKKEAINLRNQQWIEEIRKGKNRANVGLEAIMKNEKPSDFWKGYWRGQIELCEALKTKMEEK